MDRQLWTVGQRIVAVLALAGIVFVGLALTGTLPFPPPSPAGATQYCTQYEYNNTCGPLVPPLIAFQSNRDGANNTEVYVMNRDGSSQTRLFANADRFDGEPTWSPDGTKIAFASSRDVGLHIYAMNADGNSQTRLTNSTRNDSDPAWSPDGTKIAFAGRTPPGFESQIYAMNADGSGQIQLTHDPVGAQDGKPAWSPDSTKIAFESEATPGDFSSMEIYVMNADGSGRNRLTTNTAYDGDPAWSPDGTEIAFDSRRDATEAVYVMNADGSGQGRVTSLNTFSSSPTWVPSIGGPGHGTLAFVVTTGNNADIYGPLGPLTTSGSGNVEPESQRTVPTRPLAVSASVGDGQATVFFRPPLSTGGAAISSYTVTSAPGGVQASAPANPADDIVSITVKGLTNGVTYTFTVTATNGAGAGPPSAPSNAILVGDLSPPTASPTQFPPANANGWNNTDVTVTWNWTDGPGGSGVDTADCTNASVSSGEGASIVLNAICLDRNHNVGSASYTVKVDKTSPSLSPSVSPNLVAFNGTATVAANATDGLSGIDSPSCGALDTSTPGVHSVSCTATDRAGNTATASTTYTVASPLAPGTTTCNGPFSGTGTNVIVPAGASCTLLAQTHVTHDVTVALGGTLSDLGSRIDHDLTGNQPAGIQVAGATVGHNLTINGITGSPPGGNYIRDASVANDLVVQNAVAALTISLNTVGHDLIVQGNRPGGVTISGNSAGHAAICQANSPQSGSGNTAVGMNSCPA